MKKYGLYLFDFDGTLFDTLDSLKEAYRNTFKKYGVYKPYDDYAKYLGMSLPLTRATKGIDIKFEQEFIDYFHNLVHTEKVVKKTKLFKDTLATINYLNKHHIKYGIVTGSSTFRVKSVFKHFKLDPNKIITIVGNDTYKKPKPNPEPILIALKNTGYINKKDDVLYIGDGLQDEKCSKAAGIKCVLVKRPNNNASLKSMLDIFK